MALEHTQNYKKGQCTYKIEPAVVLQIGEGVDQVMQVKGASVGLLWDTCGPPKPTSDPDLQENGSSSLLISNDMKKPHDIFHLVLFN